MTVEIRVTNDFQKSAKKLIKKYASLKSELSALQEQLENDPQFGTPLGNDCYKIRMAVKSKGKGKSGGLRVITHVIAKVKTTENGQIIVYMLYIYDKSDFETISAKEIGAMVNDISQKGG